MWQVVVGCRAARTCHFYGLALIILYTRFVSITYGRSLQLQTERHTLIIYASFIGHIAGIA